MFVPFDASAQMKHVIRPGDSFESIAKKYNVSLDALMQANPGFSKCYTGMSLNIPTANTTNADVVTETNHNHQVAVISSNIQEEPKKQVLEVEETPEIVTIPSSTETIVQKNQSAKNDYDLSVAHAAVTYDLLFADVDKKFSMTATFSNDFHFHRYLYAGGGLGFSVVKVGTEIQGYESSVMSYNLEVPLYFGVSLCNGWLNLDTGPYMSIAVAGNQTISYEGEELSNTKFKDIENLERVSFGWEFNIHFCKSFTIGLNATFNDGSFGDNVTSMSFGLKF